MASWDWARLVRGCPAQMDGSSFDSKLPRVPRLWESRLAHGRPLSLQLSYSLSRFSAKKNTKIHEKEE